MKLIKSILLTAILLGAAAPAAAVTADEMDRARAITAKVYLRWANDGSGYLDQITPTSMADLEKALQGKEKENIKAVKAIALPAGYESWNKEQLVAYWSDTFFKSPGLSEAGTRGGARSQVRKRVGAMTISAPAPAQTPSGDGAASQGLSPDQIVEQGADPAADADAAGINATAAQADSIASQLAEAERRKAQSSSGSSNTWIYVTLLAILVIVVVVLVIYASNSMKGGEKNGKRGKRPAREPEGLEEREETEPAEWKEEVVEQQEIIAPAQPSAAESNRMREKFAATLAGKQEEIRLLNRRVADLSDESARLASEVQMLRTENARLRAEYEALEAGQNRRASTQQPHDTPAATSVAAAPQPTIREIYLGRVNSRGIFIRADRSLNPGNSIYRLVTSDGFSGTFRVVASDALSPTVFARPEEWLGGGCVAKDITDTDGRTEVITESPGTAIFEDGCWRVIRKAKIRYQ